MSKHAPKGAKPHIDSRPSGYSGHNMATGVATRGVLIALALSPVFAFVATVATRKNALHEGFDKNPTAR
jgi:hypothetical protein